MRIDGIPPTDYERQAKSRMAFASELRFRDESIGSSVHSSECSLRFDVVCETTRQSTAEAKGRTKHLASRLRKKLCWSRLPRSPLNES